MPVGETGAAPILARTRADRSEHHELPARTRGSIPPRLDAVPRWAAVPWAFTWSTRRPFGCRPRRGAFTYSPAPAPRPLLAAVPSGTGPADHSRALSRFLPRMRGRGLPKCNTRPSPRGCAISGGVERAEWRASRLSRYGSGTSCRTSCIPGQRIGLSFALAAATTITPAVSRRMSGRAGRASATRRRRCRREFFVFDSVLESVQVVAGPRHVRDVLHIQVDDFVHPSGPTRPYQLRLAVGDSRCSAGRCRSLSPRPHERGELDPDGRSGAAFPLRARCILNGELLPKRSRPVRTVSAIAFSDLRLAISMSAQRDPGTHRQCLWGGPSRR